MTNEEAIKEIGQMRVSLIETVFVEPKSVQKKDEALAMATIALRQNQWIPCSERLPKENGNYLVTAIWNGKREVDMDYFQFLCQWDDYKDTVVAWMPLPEPYKGGEE